MKKILRHNSFAMKIIIPTLFTMLLQIILIVCAIFLGGPYKRLKSSETDSFISKVDLRETYFTSNMNNKWGNISDDAKNLNDEMAFFAKQNNIEINEFLSDTNYQDSYLNHLIKTDFFFSKIIERNQVNNVFILLNNTIENTKKQGIFLRYNDEFSRQLDDRKVLVETASNNIKEHLLYDYNYSLSTHYEEVFDLDHISNLSFIDKPMLAAQNVDLNFHDTNKLAYWNDHFSYHEQETISCTVPLVYNEVCYGILGVAIPKNYLVKTLKTFNNSDTSVDNVSLLRHDNNYDVVLSEVIDPTLNNIDFNTIGVNAIANKNSQIKRTKDLCYYEKEISLYSKDSPYNEHWCIIGVSTIDDVYIASKSISDHIIVSVVIVCIIGVVAEILVVLFINKPIKKVVSNLNNNNHQFHNCKTNIYEIDMLLEEVRKSQNSSLDLPDRLNHIADLANLDFGVAEYNSVSQKFNISKKCRSLICDREDRISYGEFSKLIVEFKLNSVDTRNDGIVFVNYKNEYILFNTHVNGDETTFVFSNITSAYNEKSRLEYERNYDILTGIYNRNGFIKKLTTIRNLVDISSSFLMFIDLDNLKNVNDRFGHSEGDNYIKATAKAINLADENVISSHFSGDEFYVFAYGKKEKLEEIIQRIKTRITQSSIVVGNEKYPLNVSAGIVFNSDEIINLKEFIKRADFAMYEIKKSSKNAFGYFNKEHYIAFKYQQDLTTVFNNMISTKDYSFAYQPIVNLIDGKILGYESLFRANHELLKSPKTVIEIASLNGKLNEIEEMSFNTVDQFVTLKGSKGKYLFINSLANHLLSRETFKSFVKKIEREKLQVVIEVTEDEVSTSNVIKQKLDDAQKAHAFIAVDDYGTGYNTISSLLDYNPKFVKIEQTFIKDIDKNSIKLDLAKSMVNFCKQNNIFIIAEGVETVAEFNVVLELGIDFAQGYFIGRPCKTLEDISPQSKQLIKQFNEFKKLDSE